MACDPRPRGGSRRPRTPWVALRPYVAAGLLAASLGACSDEGEPRPGAGAPGAPDPQAPQLRDSAGIRIVESPLRAPDSTSWWIDSLPSLQLGSDEALGGRYVFGSVAGADWLSDGSLIVADALAPELRVFDAAGGFVRALVRRGNGPGEYTRIGDVFVLAGDTVVVQSGYEGWPVSVFAPDGSYVRAWGLPAAPDAASPEAAYDSPRIRAFFSDGSALVAYRVRDLSYRDRAAQQPLTPVLGETRTRLLRVDREGQTLADYGEHVTGRARYYHPGGDPRASGLLMSSFLPQPSLTVHGTELYLADGGPFEVRVYDGEGRLARILRKAHEEEAVPPARIDELWSRMTEDLPPSLAWISGITPPGGSEPAPAIDFMTVDDAGSLWVRSGLPGDPVAPSWFVFDPSGILRHALTADLHPMRITNDRVLAVRRSDLGVESVAVFTLHQEGTRR